MAQTTPGPRRKGNDQPPTIDGQVVNRGGPPPPQQAPPQQAPHFPPPPGYEYPANPGPYPPQAYYEAPPQPPNFITKAAVLMITLVAGLYLVNPTAGVLELIPDVIPVLGNLDEATALALLLSGLNFFGLNMQWLSHIFGPGMSAAKRQRGP